MTSAWLRPPPPVATVVAGRERRVLHWEIALVLLVTLGMSGLRSLVSLLDSLAAPAPLSDQSVAINVPQASADLLDLAGQLLSILRLTAWGGLGIFLLWRGGLALRAVGLDRSAPRRDLLSGAGLAALIGIPGLGFYLVTRAIGINLTVVPTELGDTWWRVPVLVGAAMANAWAEEALVVAYLITRLRQLGWSENRSLLASALLRGSYHLYQGFGGFLGNVVLGLVFGRVWQRTHRLWALVVGHALIDVVAFVGYALLAPHVGWL
ncbi:CPBP family intramembrane glutamic endopeptidase [Rhodococcus sp. X156]|uniref:CPBP family intramembrane glutamic endopeptidase n=1 Tax=Rhodococcus sp. X156 TaxID=2499145 RepID=UPI001F493AD5|nr:CPBP family intramembrane glutamic endopeptidase [Rhodococcus sp. X156]